MKDNWLNKLMIAAGLFAVLILVGLLTVRKPAIRYKLNEQETLAAVVSSADELPVANAEEILKSKKTEYQFVDIRTPYEFIKGHIEGAVNIPLSNLFAEDNYDFLKQAAKDNKALVLYGNSQSQAIAPWMLLKQIGISKVYILQGNHSYSFDGQISTDSIQNKGIDVEAARYNYAEIVNGKAKAGNAEGSKAVPQKVVTTAKPKSSAPAAGGC